MLEDVDGLGSVADEVFQAVPPLEFGLFEEHRERQHLYHANYVFVAVAKHKSQENMDYLANLFQVSPSLRLCELLGCRSYFMHMFEPQVPELVKDVSAALDAVVLSVEILS